MMRRKCLIDLSKRLPIDDLQTSADRSEGVSGTVFRGVHGDRRAVVVGTDQSTQLGGLMDLLHLHLVDAPIPSGRRVDRDEVVLIFLEDSPVKPETEDALRTLATCVVGGPKVALKALSPEGQLRHVQPRLPDFRDADLYRFRRWLKLLQGVGEAPPAVVGDLVERAGVPALRVYPQLTDKGCWSLRLEGLEVGRFSGASGLLGVGEVGKNGDNGPERTAFLEIAGGAPVLVDAADDFSVAAAADVLKRYARRMLPGALPEGAEAHHSEHALESRILRGRVPLRTRHGQQLRLLKGPHPLVNWGSQFPTRWGRTQASSGRYLDALLRDGRTPWAVEIKIDKPTLGVSAYYRHAVAQAVLYREFIRTATPLSPWFEEQALYQSACRAAVVVPEFKPDEAPWDAKLERLCRTFDVELIRVPRRFAELRDVDAPIPHPVGAPVAGGGVERDGDA